MPEGPEIRRAADRIASAVEGRRAEEVFFASPKLKRFERLLAGKRVTSMRTRGKALLTRFEGGRVVYSHNQLYGKWFIARRGRRPRTGRSEHSSSDPPLLSERRRDQPSSARERLEGSRGAAKRVPVRLFARAGRACYRCGTKIEKRDVSGRRLYLCPRQPEAR